MQGIYLVSGLRAVFGCSHHERRPPLLILMLNKCTLLPLRHLLEQVAQGLGIVACGSFPNILCTTRGLSDCFWSVKAVIACTMKLDRRNTKGDLVSAVGKACSFLQLHSGVHP